jgi:myo-inositol-1(or 4)-monophosphatase
MVPNITRELEEIVKEAGKLLLSYWKTGVCEIKKDAGYYTQADIDSETYLKEKLYALFPADFIAEESGVSGASNNGYRWVIDPLDGTTNFAHRISYFCVSVALTHHDEPIIGAVYNPLMDEYYYAQKGAGATLNGTQIRVSQPEKFSNALIGFGLAYDARHRAETVGRAQIIATQARSVRHFGAVALDFANLACGRLDGVIFSHLSWWDIAAGILLVSEAGGSASQIDGSALGPNFVSCVAGGHMVYKKLKELAKSPTDS